MLLSTTNPAMSKYQLTINCESAQEVAQLATLLAAASTGANKSPRMGDARIAAEDRPDAGIEPDFARGLAQPVSLAFGQEPAQFAPALRPVAAPLPSSTPAPSSAGAGAQPTALAPPSFIPAPPPAPPAPAPSTAAAEDAQTDTATPLDSVVGAETDNTGLPWDGKIHSLSGDGTKGKNKDGSWRSRRNLDPAVKASVEAQLRSLVALNTTSAPPPPAYVAGTAPPPPTTVSANPLGPLLVFLAPHFASGKLTAQQADAVAAKHGLQNLGQLVLTPNLLPVVEAELREMVA